MDGWMDGRIDGWTDGWMDGVLRHFKHANSNYVMPEIVCLG